MNLYNCVRIPLHVMQLSMICPTTLTGKDGDIGWGMSVLLNSSNDTCPVRVYVINSSPRGGQAIQCILHLVVGHANADYLPPSPSPPPLAPPLQPVCGGSI
jgi:hypothetical protein